MGTYWIVDVVCQMGGSRVSAWKTERDFTRKEVIFTHICYFGYSWVYLHPQVPCQINSRLKTEFPVVGEKSV